MRKIAGSCLQFIKKETVLCAAVLLAVISSFLVPPSLAYVGYIDWDTLALLFSLMAVMKGFQKAGLFEYLGNRLLKKAATSRSMLLVLVFLPFVSSMVVTNDVSLLTFVPFGMAVLRMAGEERLLVPLVVLQTVAANLGSMLTPMGNPQNLYLYTKSGMGAGGFCLLMLPYVLLSATALVFLILLRKSVPITGAASAAVLKSRKALLGSTAGFAICLLGIFRLVPPPVIAVLVAVFLLATDRKLLAGVDYSLLATFVALFIFIGNIGSIEGFKNFLMSVLAGHEALTAVLASQVISNVPAALLLSGFTDKWPALIVGCNLGGLGTLVASMASLISYKMVAREYPGCRGTYLGRFTLLNVCLLAVLLLAYYLLCR